MALVECSGMRRKVRSKCVENDLKTIRRGQTAQTAQNNVGTRDRIAIKGIFSALRIVNVYAGFREPV